MLLAGLFFFFFPKSPANHYCYWFMFNIGGEDRFISWAADWVTHGILYYRKHTHTIDNTFCKDHSWAADSVDAWRSILQRTHSVDDTLKKKDQRFILEPLIQLTHRERGCWKGVSVFHHPNALICVSHLLFWWFFIFIIFIIFFCQFVYFILLFYFWNISSAFPDFYYYYCYIIAIVIVIIINS